MENAQNIQPVTGKLGLDDLIAALHTAAQEKVRLSRFQVDEIFHLIMNEIPYAFQVITPILAEVLLDDSPHQTTSLALNHVVVDIGNALFNPVQKDEVHELIVTYLASRKRLEQEYASEILAQIFPENMLKPFPESAYAALRQLAHSMVENVINEKQLRKVKAYMPRPLTDIIRPVVYSKLHKLELDKIKFTQLDAFRHFISTITYDSYEKILDQNRLQQILQEKEEAYLTFKDAIRKKAPEGETLTQFYDRVKYEQFDRNKKNEMLLQQLDTFLKPGDVKTAMGYLSHHLRIRFTEHLRKLLFEKDITPATYQSNESIKDAHDMEFEKVEYDVKAIKTLMTYVLAIRSNFKKNLLHQFTGKKFFALIEDAMVVSLLGNVTTKFDPVSGRKIAARDGGYLKLSLFEIYKTMYKRLSAIMNGVNGMFADKLKGQIRDAMANIRASATQWEGEFEALADVEEVVAEEQIPTIAPVPETQVEAPQASIPIVETLVPPEPDVTETVEAPTLPEPTIKEETTLLEATAVPESPLEIAPEPEIAASVEEPITLEPALTEETIVLEATTVPEPMLVEDKPEETVVPPEPEVTTTVEEPITLESILNGKHTIDEPPSVSEPTQDKVEVKPLAIDETSVSEETTEIEPLVARVEPRPLEIDESLLTEESVDTAESQSLDEPMQEKVEPKPLAIDVSFEDEIPLVETSQETVEVKPLLVDVDFTEEEPSPTTTEETVEKIEPKPLQIDVDFASEDELIPSSAVEVKAPAAAGDSRLQTGLDIMNNYQLGDMKSFVENAWKMMLQATGEASQQADGMDISSDCEVRLYVICDLIQQVSSVDVSGLSESKKQILQDIKHKLMDALDNPLDENNWGFFEGIRRDNIDRTLSSL